MNRQLSKQSFFTLLDMIRDGATTASEVIQVSRCHRLFARTPLAFRLMAIKRLNETQ